MRLKNPLPPKCPPRHLHVVTLLEQSAWWATESSPVYASPPETKSQKDGRWKTSAQGDGVSIKTPRGRQRETTSLYFPRHTELDWTFTSRRFPLKRYHRGEDGGEKDERMMLGGMMTNGYGELKEKAQQRIVWRHWRLEPAEGQST